MAPLRFGLLAASALAAVASAAPTADPEGSVTRPLSPDYRIHPDGSVTLRICYNASCARTERIRFAAEDMSDVTRHMAFCSTGGLHQRLQRLRIGVWRMEVLAQKYQPLLGNDRAVNDQEFGVEGRTDCVDNASNTSTFLQILDDLGQLPGWQVSPARVRKPLDFALVHWTAVVIDERTGEPWAVDSWFRPHGHLPFVMPLADWTRGHPAWEPPFDVLNPYPRTTRALCQD